MHAPAAISSTASLRNDRGTERRAVWWLLGACVLLLVVVRARWVGHLLAWDEAMALCTTRAFQAGVDDPFAAWIWRHPPLHTLALLLLGPGGAGFAERAEAFSIAVAALNQVLLFFLNRRVFGTAAGLWSALVVALLPAGAFFDVWIKQDHLVVTFGLLALWSLRSGRAAWAGGCLGLALLSKGTGSFYCLAAFLLWCGGERRGKDLARLVGVSAVVCGWWFLGVLPNVGAPGAADTLQFAASTSALWRGDWFFYFAQMPAQLGWLGVVLAVAGTWGVMRTARTTAGDPPQVGRLWPLCVLGPALLLLSLVPNKVSWVVICLFPAWATLIAVAAERGVSWLGRRWGETRPWWRLAGAAMAAVAVVLAYAPALLRGYEPLARRLVESQWRGAEQSKAAADVVNQNVPDSARLLLTSFHYWQGMPPGLPDPIFTYYLEKKPGVLLRSHRCTLAELASDIRQYQIDWALLSPEPADAPATFGGLVSALRVPPYKTPGAWLFHTAGWGGPSTTNLVWTEPER